VIGPGTELRYAHVDDHSADHAPIDDVLAVLTTDVVEESGVLA
jgi:hypothetical protein